MSGAHSFFALHLRLIHLLASVLLFSSADSQSVDARVARCSHTARYDQFHAHHPRPFAHYLNLSPSVRLSVCLSAFVRNHSPTYCTTGTAARNCAVASHIGRSVARSVGTADAVRSSLRGAPPPLIQLPQRGSYSPFLFPSELAACASSVTLYCAEFPLHMPKASDRRAPRDLVRVR